jgi:hypothetical protein
MIFESSERLIGANGQRVAEPLGRSPFLSTTFGGLDDVALVELRIECSFPADELTVGAWKNLVSKTES